MDRWTLGRPPTTELCRYTFGCTRKTHTRIISTPESSVKMNLSGEVNWIRSHTDVSCMSFTVSLQRNRYSFDRNNWAKFVQAQFLFAEFPFNIIQYVILFFSTASWRLLLALFFPCLLRYLLVFFRSIRRLTFFLILNANQHKFFIRILSIMQWVAHQRDVSVVLNDGTLVHTRRRWKHDWFHLARPNIYVPNTAMGLWEINWVVWWNVDGKLRAVVGMSVSLCALSPGKWNLFMRDRRIGHILLFYSLFSHS